MVYSDINRISTNLNSLRLSTPSNMEGDGSSSGDSPIALSHLPQQNNQNAMKMSSEEALIKLTERTKYLILQENGQRRYGPPPDWQGPAPPRGCEVFIGKIPRDCFEDELVPIFETAGRIYMFRLMMDFSGSNRGYGFCIYTNREDTKVAVQKLDNYEIRKGKILGVCLSVDNCRLFVGGIPKTKNKNEIMTEMMKVTDGVRDVIVYPSAADKTKNRGFAFVEYESHKAAAMARRKLIPGRIQLWGHQIAVDWAEPEREVDEDIMGQVKILYVRNLMLTTTEETLRDRFTRAAGGGDVIERVKKIRDYAFVHFRERDQAANALNALDNSDIDSSRIEVTWAKPVEKTEYVRYTRGGGKNVQIQVSNPQTFPGSQLILDPYMASYASLYTNGGPVSSNGTPTGLSPSGNYMRGNGIRGRTYRNAAGSRSAGSRNNNNNSGYQTREKKHPCEVLEEMCQKNNWGTPNYATLLVNEAVDPATGNKVPFYLGHVSLPNICRQFQAPQLCTSVEEMKVVVAEYALQMMQFQSQPIDANLQAGIPFLSGGATDTPHLGPLLYDPAGMIPTGAGPFFNPAAALVGSELFTRY